MLIFIKMKLRIFSNEDKEGYKPLIEKTFSQEGIDLEIEMDENVEFKNKIPKGYDIYLLHISHCKPEQVGILRVAQPKSVIMIRTGAQTSLEVDKLKQISKLGRINGFYGPSSLSRGLSGVYNQRDIARMCLETIGVTA